MALTHRVERIQNRCAKKSARCWPPKSRDPGVGLVTVTRAKVTRRPVAGARLLDACSATPTSARRRIKALERAARLRAPPAGRAAVAAPRRPKCKFIFDESVGGAGSHRGDHPGDPRRGRGAHRRRTRPSSTTAVRRRRGHRRRRRRTGQRVTRAQRLSRRRRAAICSTSSAAARRFVVASHQRPDGDAIGSAHGAWRWRCARSARTRRWSMRDAPPPVFLQPFPGVDGIRITPEVDRDVRRGADHGVQRPDAHRRARPRSIAGDEHRSPSRQHALRRGQLDRRIGGGVRRDGRSR